MLVANPAFRLLVMVAYGSTSYDAARDVCNNDLWCASLDAGEWQGPLTGFEVGPVDMAYDYLMAKYDSNLL